jgi:RimJ/RimL family protein N-acetyltransferase
MTEHEREDRDQRMLMPRSAPPADIAAPRTAARPAEERAARAARARDAREVATLEAQLRAIERDIRTVGRSSRRAAEPPALARLLHEDHPAPRPHGERVPLRGGASIVIRPVEPEDADQLKVGFEHLSAVSRYRRFLTSIDQLSPRQLSYLTHVDHTAHEAIAALDASTGEGVGIARYLRDPVDPRLAEIAVTVADAWQGRGVGTALLERLAARARAAGIERITARMIVGNDAARRLIARVADITSEQRGAGTVQITARLREPR